MLRRALFFLALLNRRIFRINKPVFVILVTNSNCNIKCNYCYGDYGNRSASENYTTREIIKLIDDLKDLGVKLLTMHGGESLLRKDIGEVINYAKLKGFYVSFNTNGYLVPLRIKEIKQVDAICVSLDGRQESNDKNRSPGCYQKVMKAIDVLHEHHMPVVVSATLTRDNRHDMKFLAQLAVEKNFRVQYSILYNSSKLRDKKSDVVLDDAEVRQTAQEILSLRKKGYPVYYSQNVLEAAIRWPYSYDEKPFLNEGEPLKGYKPIRCHHAFLKYYIDSDGRVLTCWAHNRADAPNLRKLGVKQAMKKCQEDNVCRYCAFLANNEQNALMDLSLRNILDILLIHFQDASKIK